MSKLGKIDVKELKKLNVLLSEFDSKERANLCRSGAKEIAARLLAKAISRTPVGQYASGTGKVGGTLRRGWTVEPEVKNVGDAYGIDVINPTHYASYVEFGHRTRGGKGWVKGRFMLTESENEVRDQAPKILERRFEKRMREIINGKRNR